MVPLMGELLLGLRYFRDALPVFFFCVKGELLLGLPYLRNVSKRTYLCRQGELLLDLPYLRNIEAPSGTLVGVNYYLDYRTSETNGTPRAYL